MQDPSDQSSHSRTQSASTDHGGEKPIKPPIELHSGQVLLRLLCHVKTIGGVIGASGKIIKQLEYETGARIKVEGPVPKCQERVINIVGYPALYKRVSLEGEEWEVSQAQEALIRVFERVLEVDGVIDGVARCRLVAVMGQIGAIIGKGGCIVARLRRNTGARISVLQGENFPACVSPAERLIQIMGDVLAVKKALLAVSGCLQDFIPVGWPLADMSSFGDSPNQQAKFPPHRSPSWPQFPDNCVEHASTDISLLAGSNKRNVVFRLLCSIDVAGGVIGNRGTIIRTLEKETGASIKFAPNVAGCKERVVIISGFERPEPVYSPAQIATIRAFSRIIEAGIEMGFVSGLNKGEHVRARLLVASTQVDCLTDEGKVDSDISTVCGVLMKFVEGDLVPKCAAESDQVVQITGEYGNVRSAISLVTARLRNDLFSSKVVDGARAKNDSNSAISDLRPCGEGEECTSPGLDHSSGRSPLDEKKTLTRGMAHLGLSPAQCLSSQIRSSGSKRANENSERGLTTFRGRIEHGSVKPSVVANRVVEVVFPEPDFNSICGEDHSNLAKVKQISGANVTVQDPCPGASERKVIISGTSDQTMVARSLLQAFLLSVQ